MPSSAYTGWLLPLLHDAAELDEAHANLRTGAAERQYGLGALNRTAVVMCVSAWEAYLEELVKEAVNAIRPLQPPSGNWPSVKAAAMSAVGRFNNPNPDKVRELFADTLGLQDIQSSWTWRNFTPQQARTKLQRVLNYRHEVAHGVNPRPTIHNHYSSQLPEFFRRLGRCTDDATRVYLVDALGVQNPWPQ